MAIYFGSLAVQPRYYYILPILIKFGRCGLLPCSRMMQLILLKSLPARASLSEKELKESNASVKHLLESETSNTEASSTEI